MSDAGKTRETRAGYIVPVDLPRIIEYLDVTDYGPCDDGATAVCPHCGADGRYVHEFRCEDGTVRGAMRGCMGLFPISPIATRHQKLVERERDLQKRFGADAKLNSWDRNMMAAIQEFYAGTVTEQDALRTIERESMKKQAYRNSKKGGR
jgi:hypothetical protein